MGRLPAKGGDSIIRPYTCTGEGRAMRIKDLEEKFTKWADVNGYKSYTKRDELLGNAALIFGIYKEGSSLVASKIILLSHIPPLEECFEQLKQGYVDKT